MGFLDNVIRSVIGEMVKAPNANTSSNFAGYGNAVPLDRPADIGSVPFAPAVPLIPANINPLGDNGRPAPRKWEFEVAQNINVTSNRLVPFKTLRASAEQIDILRRCVEVLKAKMAGLDWDIVLSTDATEAVAAETGLPNLRAQQVAKEKFGDEIARARAFWKVPDKSNGLIFAEWLGMLLEDNLVIDAVAVYPQKSVKGDLHSLQILDGSTIKPLIDDRGMRPAVPNAAFQQVLYGFPRSEFSAPDEEVAADGEFTADELSYLVRNKRTFSTFGFSPVERALPLADLYLRRQQWLRAEYTDGVMPSLMFTTDASFGNSPDLLRAYENVFNDDLAGQTEQRKRARLLPAGLNPVQFDGYGEKFSNVLDEYLVHSICGHFGVLPSEIGFAAKGGLGGSGVQQGEASSSEVIGLLPLAEWVGRMISQLSYVYLGMPRELEFKFQPSGRNDGEAMARSTDIRVKNGTMTLNEARAEAGLPLLDAEEADTPIMVAGAGAYFITENGVMDLATGSSVDATEETPATPATTETATETPATGQDKPAEPETDNPKAVTAELKTFMRWLRKSPNRAFEFKLMPAVYAETLNKFVEIGDHEGARWYAERYLN
jgi:hypothetical protein